MSPPEGFVADADNLSEEVNSEVEAVQFTITDVGSDWVPTGVTMTHVGQEFTFGLGCCPSLFKD